MEYHEIAQDVYVCGQLETTDIEALAKMGIKTIICNRPDAEGVNQPEFAIIAESAKLYGITSYYVPVTPPTLLPETVAHMRQIINEAQKPIVAYCLSGGRSQYLYQIAQS